MSKNQFQKGKPSCFKLSSSFNQLINSRKQQTQEFIKDLTDKNDQPLVKSKQKSKQKSINKNSSTKSLNQNSLFKFNTNSQSLLNDVPVQYIKKKSKSRLQSMNDEDNFKNKFFLLENQTEKKQSIMKDRTQLLKKYNINLNAVMSQQIANNKPILNQQQYSIEQEDPQGTVKPSQAYQVSQILSNPFTVPTIFQTPLLPCFSSEFTLNPQFCTSKAIKEGQGVWRIGKIKIKKNKALLKIGQIQFESQYINGQGRCIGIKQDFLYKTKNWNGIWVCQPKQENFN